MKYRELEYSRTFNLGEYESERVALRADLDETDDIDETFKTMKGRVFKLHEEGQLLEETKAVVEAEKQLDSSEDLWDPEKISWVEAEGAKGKYERYPALHQKAEFTADYQNMLKDIKEHGDRMARGDYFYWCFQDGATVGRKKRK